MKNLSELPLHSLEARTHNGIRFTISLPTVAVRTSEHVAAWDICRVDKHVPLEPRHCASVNVMPVAKERTAVQLAAAAGQTRETAGGAPQRATVRALPDGTLVITEEDDDALVSVKRYIGRTDFDLVCSYSERTHGGVPWYAATRSWAERICMSLTILAP